MGKFIVRITIILTSLYLSASYIIAQIYGVDILKYTYTLLFELCTLIYTFSEGKYHCRFMRWTMLGIFISDSISHLDYYFDFVSINVYNLLLALILFISFGVSCISAIHHFYKVRKNKMNSHEIR